METPLRDYSALHQAHARALGELNQHVEQQEKPAIEAGQEQARISGTERIAASASERGTEHAPENEALPPRDGTDYLDHALAALDKLDRYLEERQDRATAADRSAAPAALNRDIEQRPESAVENGEPPVPPPQRDYSILKEEHARSLDAAARRGDEDEMAPNVEPSRPTELRSPGWTHHGGMVEQQTSAIARDRFIRQRLARAALDRHIEETRSDHSTDIAKGAGRDRGDDGVEVPEQAHRGNYALLEEEHAKALDALNTRGDRDDITAEQASTLAASKAERQQQAREALDRHIEEIRDDRGADSPDAAPDKGIDRDRGDGGIER